MLEELFNAEEAKRLSEQQKTEDEKNQIIEEGAWNEIIHLIKKAAAEHKDRIFTQNYQMTKEMKKKLESKGYKVNVGRSWWLRAEAEIIW